MIAQNLALIIAVAIPVIIIVLLRANAAIIFLSLCAGALLVRFIGEDAGLVGSAIGNNSEALHQYFQIGLLLLPVILSTIFLRKSMRGPKGILNILPAVGVGLVGVLLAVPLLPANLQSSIISTQGWHLLQQSQGLVVAASVLISLVALWFSHHAPHGGRKHHR